VVRSLLPTLLVTWRRSHQRRRSGKGAAEDAESPTHSLSSRFLVAHFRVTGDASAVARARRAELRALHVVSPEGALIPAHLGGFERQDLMSRLRVSLEAAALPTAWSGRPSVRGIRQRRFFVFARVMPAHLIAMGVASADRPERPIGPIASVVVSRSECPVITAGGQFAIRPEIPR
jgi:nucleotide-binding universal stress UspA family protein